MLSYTLNPQKAHVGFMCFHVLFKEGKGHHGRLQYKDALKLIIDHGNDEYEIDLSQKERRVMILKWVKGRQSRSISMWLVMV